jgi:hypothetical protein
LLPPIPADWPTYEDPRGLYKIRYPVDWLEIDGDFYSADPSGGIGYSLPPEIVKVETTYNAAAGSSTCGGILSTDVQTGQFLGPLPGARPTVHGGLPAWQIVREEGSGIEENLTRVQGIVLVYEGDCLILAAYFTQQEPDVTTFLQIASTFEFRS